MRRPQNKPLKLLNYRTSHKLINPSIYKLQNNVKVHPYGPAQVPFRQSTAPLTATSSPKKWLNCQHRKLTIHFPLFYCSKHSTLNTPLLSTLHFFQLSTIIYQLYIFQYVTGRMVMVRGRVRREPKQMTTPIGIQRLVWAIIIGRTPSAVVAVVRKIGRIRRIPAS